MRNIDEIIEINNYRNQKFLQLYDPYSGEGACGDRVPVVFSNGRVIHLPVEMKINPVIDHLFREGDTRKLISTRSPKQLQQLETQILFDRFDHDFEYWCAQAVIITDKETNNDVPFILNYPQRKYLELLERDRKAGVPIRIIIAKARQWGGSTLTEIYMSWVQNRLKKNWNSIIITQVEDQARHIRGMYNKMAKAYPGYLGTITFAPYQKSSKIIQIKERGNIIGIGSMEKPDSSRSFTFSMAHLSEVGLWKKTEGKSPEDVVQSVRASILSEPLTIQVLESTAKGVGNFFHHEYTEAEKGETNYNALFVGYHEIPLYTLPINDYKKFIENMTDNDIVHWKTGATLEAINWYKTHKAGENYSDWRMCSEYPLTAKEAFQNTGHRVFEPIYVMKARETCRKPEFVGELYAKAKKGKQALEDIRFTKTNEQGHLKIWMWPDNSIKISNRYALFADIGGKTKKADYSVVKVFDRYWQMEGGVPEVAAVWRGHIDQDLFAWICAQMGKMYNNGLVAIETNSLKKEKEGTEGDHFLTVLDEIAEHYDNLFTRTDVEKIKEGLPIKWGFHTNEKTKAMIIDELVAALRDDTYIERDVLACDEMDSYEVKPNGSYGAVEGSKDDNVIVTAGGVWLCNKYMDLPKEVRMSKKNLTKKIISEASI